jgi:hypothetical protein
MRGTAHGFCFIMLPRGRCHGYVMNLIVRMSGQHFPPLPSDRILLALHLCAISCDACNTNPNPGDISGTTDLSC